MPFTLYHLAPVLLLGMVFLHYIDLLSFLLSSIIIDIEPLFIIIFKTSQQMHGIWHSFTFGSFIAIILSIILYMSNDYLLKISTFLRVPQKSNYPQILFTSLIGVWSHVFLDALFYPEVNIFFPLRWNPVHNILPLEIVNSLLALAFPFSIIAYILRIVIERKKQVNTLSNTRKHTSHIFEKKSKVKNEDEYLKSDIINKNINETNEVNPNIKKLSLEKKSIPSQLDLDIPKIILGSERSPKQWGIIGKSEGEYVGVDLNEPHIVFVCGKQGSGKGYTIGTLCEMLLSKSISNISHVTKPATIIVFHKPREDVKNEFWSIIWENINSKEVEALKEEYNALPTRVITDKKLKIFIDPFVYNNEKKKFIEEYKTKVHPIGINPSKLTSEDWPHVLSIGKKSGSIYVKKIFQIIKKKQYEHNFGLNSIKKEIDMSTLNPTQKNFAFMRLETLQEYLETEDFIEELVLGGVNIFDLRKIMMEPDDVFSVMILMISSILNYEKYLSEQIVFVINEAHDYLRKGLSKEFTDYINYLVRKKRHGGTWLLLDTHFPEDVDSKIIKGSDLKILHKSDILSSNLLNAILSGSKIKPHRLTTGQAIIRADKSINGPDKIVIVEIRPRVTQHGAPTKLAV
jgi:hypothetical protein